MSVGESFIWVGSQRIRVREDYVAEDSSCSYPESGPLDCTAEDSSAEVRRSCLQSSGKDAEVQSRLDFQAKDEDSDGELDAYTVFSRTECVEFVQQALAQQHPLPVLKCGKQKEYSFVVPKHFAMPRLTPYHNAVNETWRAWPRVQHDLEQRYLFAAIMFATEEDLIVPPTHPRPGHPAEGLPGLHALPDV